MNYLHKIFFVGLILAAVAAGSRFNAPVLSGDNRVSVIVSAASESPVSKQADLGTTVSRAATPNDSTTQNDIRLGGENILSPNENENPGGALDNAAILKPASIYGGRGTFRRVGSEQAPQIQAQAALVADLKTGQPYFELNPSLRWPAASLAKLITAATALKNMDLSRPLALAEDNFSVEEGASTPAGSTHSTGSGQAGFLKIGNSYSGNDILAAILLSSRSEPAETLAAAYGKTEFVSGLNSLAKEFGMDSTNFSDSTGFSVSNQSTALDLKKFAVNAYRDYPKIFDIGKKKTVSVLDLNSKKKIKLSSANPLAGAAGFAGGWAGYTDDASGNLLSVFSYGGKPVLIIVLGAEDSIGEAGALLKWFKDNFQARG